MSAGFSADATWRSWGRVEHGVHYRGQPYFRDQLEPLLQEARASRKPALAVGLGRSYGLSNLNTDGALLCMQDLDRFIAFDAENGVLRAETGASLGDILRFCVPRGWFLPTTPGTRFVTLGGAIANDVHGKNHVRAGSFGCAVRRIGLLTSHGGCIELTPDDALFAATIGGMGLTGVMEWAEIQLTQIPSSFIDYEQIAFGNLSEFFALSAESDGAFKHTVAWVDCTAGGDALGRGLFHRGNWAPDGGYVAHEDRIALSLPLDAPNGLLNAVTLAGFNLAWRALHAASPRVARTSYQKHLYPLDAIGAWNRLYGSRGFYQYQCVLPPEAAPDALADMLRTIKRFRDGSFLVVLKAMGERASLGLLSFPMRGYTLAIDFANRGAPTLELMEALDDIVAAANGRLYAAKDGRMSGAMFKQGFPRWSEFAEHVDPALSSNFWRRVSA
jgi:FAD/FMN-containing dehydrogenase